MIVVITFGVAIVITVVIISVVALGIIIYKGMPILALIRIHSITKTVHGVPLFPFVMASISMTDKINNNSIMHVCP